MNGIQMTPTTSRIKRIINKISFPGIFIILGILFFTTYISQLKNELGYVFIQLKPFQTETGWGYEILANGKTYIRQSFIPALQGEKSFKSREDALLVGNKVIEKMNQGQQLPTISIQELQQMGILRDSVR